MAEPANLAVGRLALIGTYTLTPLRKTAPAHAPPEAPYTPSALARPPLSGSGNRAGRSGSGRPLTDRPEPPGGAQSSGPYQTVVMLQNSRMPCPESSRP